MKVWCRFLPEYDPILCSIHATVEAAQRAGDAEAMSTYQTPLTWKQDKIWGWEGINKYGVLYTLQEWEVQE
jgi:hypothetical protein